jgi:hypothetical protein
MTFMAVWHFKKKNSSAFGQTEKKYTEILKNYQILRNSYGRQKRFFDHSTKDITHVSTNR